MSAPPFTFSGHHSVIGCRRRRLCVRNRGGCLLLPHADTLALTQNSPGAEPRVGPAAIPGINRDAGANRREPSAGRKGLNRLFVRDTAAGDSFLEGARKRWF